MRQLILVLLLVWGGIATATAQTNDASEIIAPGAKLIKLADGFSFTEGPVADKRGNVFFTDQPNDRILEWTVGGELRVFLDGAGRANGMYFDRRGNLLAAADALNELWSIAPDGSHTVLARGFGGHEFNGPNDIWVHPSGGIYFTDPLYARPWWTHRGPEPEQDGEHVYFLAPDRGAGHGETQHEVRRVTDDLTKPNGIVGAPDGRTLYVADIGANKTYAYDITPDGTLSGKRLFAPLGSDGMTLDSHGNLYLTGNGVTVFNSRGEQIEHIDVPAGWTANVCFGGKDRKTLFITAMDALYSIRTNVKGSK